MGFRRVYFCKKLALTLLEKINELLPFYTKRMEKRMNHLFLFLGRYTRKKQILGLRCFSFS